MEIKNLKKELEKNKFLENKNTYILIKEKNVINNSIIKKIFKKEKIIKKIN